MRKITKDSVDAFLAGRKFHKQNMSVARDGNSVLLNLHGNTIARRNVATGKLEITTAGWDTPTTKSRLNGLPGVRVWHINRQLYLYRAAQDKSVTSWDGDWITVH